MNFTKKNTASFDVDAQNTFTPRCPTELPVPDGDTIVGALNAQAQMARIRVGSKDAHAPNASWVATQEQPMFSPVDTTDSDIRWNAHAVVGSYGFALLEGLPHPREYDFFVWKGIEPDMHPYGACYHTLNWRQKRMSTGVIEYLKAEGISTVIVGGLAIDYCVRNTALQLRDAGFEVVLNLSASRGIALSTVAEAIAEMKDMGIVVVDDVTTCELFNDDIGNNLFN